MGIEPTSLAWKASILPLNYTRTDPPPLMEGGGFEPPKAEPPDLQSGPFDRSGTPPTKEQIIICDSIAHVNRLKYDQIAGYWRYKGYFMGYPWRRFIVFSAPHSRSWGRQTTARLIAAKILAFSSSVGRPNT